MGRLIQGQELAQVIDDLSGQQDVRSTQGAMGMPHYCRDGPIYSGILTNGAVPRDSAYMHGVYFAFAPFISPPQYW